jgi:type I restriction enzyme S subunit
MSIELTTVNVGECVEVLDFVANGSFASLKENVTYLDNSSADKYAVLVRTLDFNRGWNGDYVWIDEKAFNFLSKSKLFAGDLVLCNVGSVGVTFRVPDLGLPMSLGPNAVVCRTRNPDQIRQDYLYFYFRSPQGQQLLQELSGGSTVQAKFNKTDLRQASISVPSITQQDRVISILGAIESKIASNKSQTSTLEQIAQTIFKSWFVDFDPVQAKSRGEQPDGMSAKTAALFPDSLEDSEFGPIPAGWSFSTLGETSKLIMGQSPPGESYNEMGEGLPFYQGRTDFGSRFPSERVYTTAGKRLAKPGDTLISVRAPVGDANQALTECVVGRGVAALRHNSNSEIYTYSLMASLRPKLNYFNGEGTIFGAINRKDFEALNVVEPEPALVEAFETTLAPSNVLIRNLHEQNLTLEKLRDSLLPRLISGELEIPEELLGE